MKNLFEIDIVKGDERPKLGNKSSEEKGLGEKNQ